MVPKILAKFLFLIATSTISAAAPTSDTHSLSRRDEEVYLKPFSVAVDPIDNERPLLQCPLYRDECFLPEYFLPKTVVHCRYFDTISGAVLYKTYTGTYRDGTYIRHEHIILDDDEVVETLKAAPACNVGVHACHTTETENSAAGTPPQEDCIDLLGPPGMLYELAVPHYRAYSDLHFATPGFSARQGAPLVDLFSRPLLDTTINCGLFSDADGKIQTGIIRADIQDPARLGGDDPARYIQCW